VSSVDIAGHVFCDGEAIGEAIGKPPYPEGKKPAVNAVELDFYCSPGARSSIVWSLVETGGHHPDVMMRYAST
jgi:hypothetical protein